MHTTTTSTAPLLTVPEVARRLGLHRDSIYRKIQSGEIPAVRLGPADGTGPLRVPADWLERWLFAEGQ